MPTLQQDVDLREKPNPTDPFSSGQPPDGPGRRPSHRSSGAVHYTLLRTRRPPLLRRSVALRLRHNMIYPVSN